MSEILKAPWTKEQVELLKKYQSNDSVHPYTCAHSHGSLIPTISGWLCPECDYAQNWCHKFSLEMANQEPFFVAPSPEALVERIEELELEIKEHDMSFDLRWNADMRAIKRWQEETGEFMTWPDHADLSVWLLGILDKHGICTKCGELFEGCYDSPHADCGCKNTGSSEWYEPTPHMKAVNALRHKLEILKNE